MNAFNQVLMKIRLIIGLGNPGKEYQNTYHNVGFLFVDYLKNSPLTSNFSPLKSNVYMNESGSFVARELKKRGLKPEALLIAHDDSDIELSKFKLSFGRGAAGHKGAESVIKALKTEDFWRFRIGIRPEAKNEKGEAKRLKAGEFVLKKITAAHARTLKQVFEEGAKRLVQSIQNSP